MIVICLSFFTTGAIFTTNSASAILPQLLSTVSDRVVVFFCRYIVDGLLARRMPI